MKSWCIKFFQNINKEIRQISVLLPKEWSNQKIKALVKNFILKLSDLYYIHTYLVQSTGLVLIKGLSIGCLMQGSEFPLYAKAQIVSECFFTTEKIWQICALAPKEWSNQKIKPLFILIIIIIIKQNAFIFYLTNL